MTNNMAIIPIIAQTENGMRGIYFPSLTVATGFLED